MYHHHFCLCEGNGATLFADHDEEYLVDELNWIMMIGPILVTPVSIEDLVKILK